MATYGTIGEFCEKRESWHMYVDRLDEYFVANKITDGTSKRAILNAEVGPVTFKLISSLLAPKKPKEATYDEIVKLLETHFTPAKSIIVSRFTFNTRSRRQGESVSNYIAALRELAQDCNFQDLNEMLRDRLVCGINDNRMQKSMLAQGDKLDFKKAKELALSLELADNNAQTLTQTGHNHVDSVTFKQRNQNRPKSSNRKPQSKGSYHANTGGNKPKHNVGLCGNCGQSHPPKSCPAHNKECYYCHSLGHFSSCCRRKQQTRRKHVNLLESDDLSPQSSTTDMNESHDHSDQHHDNYDDGTFVVEEITESSINLRDEIIVHARTVQDKLIAMKLDSGARCNVMPKRVLMRVAPTATVDTTRTCTLTSFGGTKIHSYGVVTLTCTIGGQTKPILFRLVDKLQVPVILGLYDCLRFGLITLSPAVHQLDIHSLDEGVYDIYSEYADLFDDSVGKLPVVYRMKLDSDVSPVVRPPRRIPVAMQSKVQVELQRMTDLGVITPVSEPTSWVSSMVATHKKDSSDIRLCIDPRDLNKALKRPHHPMRTVEEVAAKMEGSTVFSVLDAKSSFWQIPLDYESSLLTCFSTPHGRYRYLRMPYGLKSASDVFQQSIEQLFGDLPCSIVVDDIIVSGRDKSEHDRNLKLVLERARKVNLKLNPKKCKFGVSQVNYVGHVFTDAGLKADSRKIEAILNMPEPTDVQGLQRYLGMVNYLSKYIPHLSEIAAPLRQLTHKNIHWSWMPQHTQAFKQIKEKIAQAPSLQYFNMSKSVTLTCDASKYGLGAACLQENGPIAYASRTMTETEQRYSQIEKELLAVLFACKKFYHYIYGRQVVVETDHKPLITIMQKPMHAIPARLQNMRLQLQKYDISLVYKKGAELYLADTLSRAPLSETTQIEHELDQFVVMTILPISDTKQVELASATKSDLHLQKLASVILHGWPDKPNSVPLEVRPYFPFRDELIINESGIILKGQRAIIPKSLQFQYTQILHDGHPGADATKRRAKDIVYWPTMCLDIDQYVSSCSVCNSMKSHQQKEPLKSFPIPSTPFEMVGVDLFHWNAQDYLAIGDSYSTWFDFCQLNNTTAHTVIHELKRLFSIHGVPRFVISDNARQFNCTDFADFSKSWNFSHITSSPQFPQANGLAESAVKRSKQLLEKTHRENSDLYKNLLNLRNIPTSTQLGSPAQRLMSRRLRSVVPADSSLLKPKVQSDVTKNLQHKRDVQKKSYDKSARSLPPLKLNQTVRLQTPQGHSKIGVVVKASGDPRSYVIRVDGTEYRRNRRHIIPVNEPPPKNELNGDLPHILQYPDNNHRAQRPPAQRLPVQPARPVITRYGRHVKPNPKYAN